jgi:hypothetical protein
MIAGVAVEGITTLFAAGRDVAAAVLDADQA